jgi:polysaccharide export outer membrane protein
LKLTFLLALALCSLVPASAQSAAAPAASAQSPAAPAASADYILGPGDEVVLHVVDLDEIPDKPIRIDPSGFIDLPLAGRVEAGGLTVEQLKATLAAKLAKYISSPHISINLTDDQSRPVSVIGAVNSPGVHQLQGPKRLIEVISMAGGVRQDAGATVILTRQAKWGTLPLPGAKVDETAGFSTATISLDSLLAAKRPAENIPVLPDDVISIPKADLVYVVGDVKKAGGFQLSSHATMSVLQALSLSEGFGPSASPKNARIMRPTEGDAAKMQEIPVDLRKIFAGKNPDVALYANDVLFVPNSLAKSSARRVAEAILQAGTGVAIYAH